MESEMKAEVSVHMSELSRCFHANLRNGAFVRKSFSSRVWLDTVPRSLRVECLKLRESSSWLAGGTLWIMWGRHTDRAPHTRVHPPVFKSERSMEIEGAGVQIWNIPYKV